MPPKVIQTSRTLKNTDTGIDVSVPCHEPASSPKRVKRFHVLVITSLPHFKEATQSEDSVVQFTVLRDFEAFENLQKDMLETFPKLKLPSLPRKYHLFLSDADVEERQISFDCLLKVLCTEKAMCTSPPFLRFLGFNGDADVRYREKRAEYVKREHHEEIDAINTDTELFSTEKKAGVFDEEYTSPGDAITVTGDDVTLEQKNYNGKRAYGPKDLFVTEEHSEVADIAEHSELLDVADTLDDLLQGERSSPVLREQLDADSSIMNLEVADVGSRTMEHSDILAYIETNTGES